jgi:exodeoxyribonuclease V alpha subunit
MFVMAQAEAPADAVSLEGSVQLVTFYNPENGFSVVRLRVRGRREPVAVVGTLPAVQPGEVLELTGHWRTDPVHGAQFRPERVAVHPPAALDDVVSYLGSGMIRQLGPVLARRIADAFGERTLEILDATPERVREVPGIGPLRAKALAAAWVEHRALRAVAAFLAEHGVDTRYAPRLVAAYGPEATSVLGANPYRLVAEVPGLGFAAADRLGRDLGVRPTSPVRLQAAVQAALLRAAEAGHTCLPRDTLVSQAAATAGVGEDLLASAVVQLRAGGVVAPAGVAAPLGPSERPGAEDEAPPPPARPGPLFSGGAVRGPATPAGAPSPGTAIRSPRLRLY